MLLAAGCAGAGSEGETETRQFGSIPMSNAPIYQQDGITAVAPTLEGTVHIVPFGFYLEDPEITNYPVAGTVSDGKITVTLPELTTDQLRDIESGSVTVTPAGTKVFPGMSLVLVVDGEDTGQVSYGTTDQTTITTAAFLYSEAGPVSIEGEFLGNAVDIASAKSGWNIVTIVAGDGIELSYSNNSPLPSKSMWFLGGLH